MQDRNAIAGLLDRIPLAMKKIDVLVNNAGMVYGTEKVGDIKQSDIDTMFSESPLYFTLDGVRAGEEISERESQNLYIY